MFLVTGTNTETKLLFYCTDKYPGSWSRDMILALGSNPGRAQNCLSIISIYCATFVEVLVRFVAVHAAFVFNLFFLTLVKIIL